MNIREQNMVAQGQYFNPIVATYLFPVSDDIDKYKVFEQYQDPERNFKTQYWPYGNLGIGMIYFCEYIGKKMGPKSINPEKIFCIDFFGQYPPSECVPYVNYLVNQTYGGSPGQLGSFPVEKCIYTENVGDNWQKNECGQLLNYARWQPAKGRKGGFGAFYMHRDYNIANDNPYPYKRFREAIQIQNPAIY